MKHNYSTIFFYTLLLCTTLLLGANSGYGQITSVASGDWSDPNTWDCVCVPGSADVVIIDHWVLLTTDVTVNALIYPGNLNYGGFTLTYTGTRTSRASGNFNNPLTWDCNCVPATTEPIIVSNTHTVTLTSNTILQAINVATGGTLDNAGFTLTLQERCPQCGERVIVNGRYQGDGATTLAANFGHSNTITGNGTVSTNGLWTIASSGSSSTDGNTDLIFSGSSDITVSGGKLTCNGAITVETGNISVNSTTLQIESTGNVILSGGKIDINNAGKVNNYGTVTVGGDISGAGLSKWFNYGTLNVAGTLLSTGKLYNYLGNTVNYNGSVNQTIKNTSAISVSLPANTYHNLTCSNKGIKSLRYDVFSPYNSLTVVGNLTIRDSAILDVRSIKPTLPVIIVDCDITLKGNWHDSSKTIQPFIHRNKKVTFSGTAPQSITTTFVHGGETFYDLVINNSDTGVVLTGGNINVSDTLTLNDGLLHTGADTVWVSNPDTAAIQNYSDTTYVNGYLKRGINPSGGSYNFPVGNADAYELANVHFFGSDTIGTLTVNFNNPAGGSTLNLTDANDAVYSNLLNCGGTTVGTGNVNAGVWNIHPGKGKAVYDLSLYGRHFGNQGTMYHSIVKRSNSTSPWAFAGTYLDASLKTDTLIAKRTCLTDFDQFAIASSNTNTPLNTIPLSFSSPDNMICGSKCIDFTSKNNFSATNWRWTLSGGAFSNLNDTLLQNPTNICFNDLGNYDVRLIASTACKADTSKKMQYVKVNYLPTASITGPSSICSGKSLQLTGIGTGNFLWSTTATTAAISESLQTATTYSLVVSTAFCSDTAFSTVAVTTTPTASINANTTAICSSGSATLTSTGTADKYLWSSGESSNTITVSPATTQSYSLTLSNGNCTDKGILTINVTTTPTATITGETSICSGKKVILSATSVIPGIAYLWSTEATSERINASSSVSTTYSVVLTNGICKDTASLYISVTTTPTLILTANISTICGGDSATLNATGVGDYLWSNGKSTSSITVSPLLPVRYSLQLSNGNCFDSDSLLITVVSMPTASISGPSTVCSGNSTILTASAGSGEGNAYIWSTGETSAGINVQSTANTTYSVTVSNGDGLCKDTASHTITLIAPVPADAGPDITIAIGLDTVLSANYGTAWNWAPQIRLDCYTCQTTIVAPFQTTSYTVTVTDINGCISSDAVKIYVIPCAELFIPQAFSPNNDGQNDLLFIRGTDCIEKINAFTIFNRWGEKVFETTDINAGWDGSQTKETLPNEVFIYYLDALSINGDAITKTGNVTLMK